MTPDLKEARRFLDFLDPFAESFAFQTFDDDKDRAALTRKNNRGFDPRARTLIGDLKSHAAKLTAMSADRCAVHVTINAIKGNARRRQNVVEIRKHFIEMDGPTLDAVLAWELKPSCIVESSPGHYHVYWDVAADVAFDLDGFTRRQAQLAKLFEAGQESIDLPRVLRLPGFDHQKGKPFRVHIVSMPKHPTAYTLLNFELALADVVVPQTMQGHNSERGTVAHDEDAHAIEAATEWYKRAPIAISEAETPEGKYHKKGNQTTYDVLCQGRDYGVERETNFDLADTFYNGRCIPSWSFEELKAINDHVYEYAQGARGAKHPLVQAREDFASDPLTEVDLKPRPITPKQPRPKRLRNTVLIDGVWYVKRKTGLERVL